MTTLETMAAEIEAHHLHNPNPLTDKQLAVLNLLAQGSTFHQVGKALDISEETAKYRARTAGRALGTKNTVHTVAEAIHRGLLPKDPK